MAVKRLILVPQLPIRMRYQEWWFSELPRRYASWFDDIVVLGGETSWVYDPSFNDQFSNMEAAIRFEMQQVEEFLSLPLKAGDVLLLCDLSFPGLFSSVLWHKRPASAFAICHASARNRYDIFAPVRSPKFASEQAVSRLFDAVFVATHYHRKKLGWKNTQVVALPYPPFPSPPLAFVKWRPIVSVARSGVQKRTASLEQIAMQTCQVDNIRLPEGIMTWQQYYCDLGTSERLLSTAKEETFGYQIVDAIIAQCIPIAPNRYAYPELLPRQYLYRDGKELRQVLRAKLPVPTLLCHKAMKNFYKTTAERMHQ